MLSFQNELKNVKAANRMFARAQKRMPIILAITLTKSAKSIRVREEREMARVFKNPRKYVLNSLFTRPATKDNLKASVEDRYFSAKGTAASNFLGPQVKGGSRKKKRSERTLERAGILPPDKYMLPSRQAPAKVRRNMGSEYSKMLSGLGAYRDDKAYMNSNLGSPGDNYFVMYERGGSKPLGIGKRNKGGSKFRLYFVFIKAPKYKKLFRYHEIAQEFGNRIMKAHFARTLRNTFR